MLLIVVPASYMYLYTVCKSDSDYYYGNYFTVLCSVVMQVYGSQEISSYEKPTLQSIKSLVATKLPI